MKRTKSQLAFETAKKLLPGGVNSPVRAFGSVEGTPPFIAKAAEAKLWDIDGNEYIDYVCSWGPAILGHAHPEVTAAIKQAAANGPSFGAPTELETKLAGMISSAMPSIEMIRFVNSGTEATMSALRLARAVSKRSKIIKFAGCYHGHADSLLVKAGSGLATQGTPTSAGISQTAAKDTLVLTYNDCEQFKNLMDEQGDSIAAVIVEPVAGNMGCVPGSKEFLQTLRTVCSQHNSILIFDEVMSGFRVSRGGAQELYGITPDLTCLGKIIGGGLPVGAYGGKKELMQNIAPLGDVYQAGTLSGNPLAMAAGLTTLKLLNRKENFTQLEKQTKKLTQGISSALSKYDIPHSINRVASMWTVFFSETKVSNFAQAENYDQTRFKDFFHFMLNNGIYLAPSAFESSFVSLAHSDEEIEQTIRTVETYGEKV